MAVVAVGSRWLGYPMETDSFLITFCNQFFGRGYTLGLYNIPEGRLHWLHTRDDGHHGRSGICVTPTGYLIGCQHAAKEYGIQGPSRIIALDPQFNLIHEYTCRAIRDIHSIIWTPSGVYAVSSGNNAVFELGLADDGSVRNERLVWAVDEDLRVVRTIVEHDQHHVNSMVMHKGRLAVSLFATGRPGDGRVVYIDTNETVMEGLYQPHSLQSLDGELVVCDSKRGEIVFGSGDRVQLGGYTRGLTWDDSFLYVGSSA